MTTHTINLNQLNQMPPIVKTIKKGNYTIRNVEPEFLPNDDLTMRMYRSVITNQTDEIVCVAPAQSMTNDAFFQMTIAIGQTTMSESNEIRATEIIEGTMINLFWETDKWEIATKRSVGGNYHFFRNRYFPGLPEPEQKTFRQMFLDGLNASFSDIGDFANSLNLSKMHCYSFVVQHPCNHIVSNVNAPATYLVSCYEIINYSCKYVDIFSLRPTFASTNVKFPRFFDDLCDAQTTTLDNAFLEVQRTDGSNPSDGTNPSVNRIYLVGQESAIMERIKSCMKNPLNSFSIPGIMITHIPTGFRTSYDNLTYTEMKMLRGNNPNLHYQYLVLRKTNKVDMFVHHFPQYRAHFNRFREHFDVVASRIHRLYLNIHVLKIHKLDDVEDKRDKYHIEKLHYEHFIPALKAFKSSETPSENLVKPKITRKMVVQYLDSENVMVPF